MQSAGSVNLGYPPHSKPRYGFRTKRCFDLLPYGHRGPMTLPISGRLTHSEC